MKRKAVSGVVLTLLLISTLSLAFNIQHAHAMQPPVASFTYSPPAPYRTLFVKLPVHFDASASYDPDGFITWYEWDFGKGYKVGSPDVSGWTTYDNAGNYTVTLTVTDNEGLTDTTTSIITVREPINLQEGEVTLYPIDDTYTDSNNPDEKYGGQTTLFVSNTTEKIAWLKFGLCAVPDGAVVDYAQLKLHALQPTETYDVYAHSCSDNSWTESTLTYSNMPVFNASHIISMYRFSYEGWGEWVVSEGVRKAIDGIYDGTDIVTIVISGIPTHHLYESSYISFHSKESLYVPELIVHWIGTDAPEDATPPNISIISPENKTYPEEDVSLTLNVHESICWIGYSLDGEANVTITGNTTLTKLSDGMHIVVVYASDRAGNIGSSDMVYFTIDTTPPSISIVAPENKTYDTADVPLTLTIDDPTSWMAYSLDGQTNVTITGNTTLTGLSEGSHSLTVYAQDTAENIGASEEIYFTVETQLSPFWMQWWFWTMVAVVVVALAGAVYFLQKRKQPNTTPLPPEGTDAVSVTDE